MDGGREQAARRSGEPGEEALAIEVWVSGRVQGVGFRWSTRRRAREDGLGGWVRNLADGRVRAWIEGDACALVRMTAWLRRGPAGARVEGLDVRERDAVGYAAFDIRPTDQG